MVVEYWLMLQPLLNWRDLDPKGDGNFDDS